MQLDSSFYNKYIDMFDTCMYKMIKYLVQISKKQKLYASLKTEFF